MREPRLSPFRVYVHGLVGLYHRAGVLRLTEGLRRLEIARTAKSREDIEDPRLRVLVQG